MRSFLVLRSSSDKASKQLSSRALLSLTAPAVEALLHPDGHVFGEGAVWRL